MLRFAKKILLIILIIFCYLVINNKVFAWEWEEVPRPDITGLEFSPNGTKLYFGADLQKEYGPQTWVINSDGTGLKCVTPFKDLWCDEFSLSPDGTKIVVSGYDDKTFESHLWIINVDGTNLHQITFEKGVQTAPAWSPDGTKIAYFGYSVGNEGSYLFVCNGDGTNSKRLTDFTSTYPTWTPDGRILFSGDIATRSYNVNEKVGVWSINPDGTDLKMLFTPMPYRIIPKVSPNGKKLVFSKFHEGGGTYGIWTCNIDGTDWQRVSPGEIDEEEQAIWPAWSPDGTKIAYIYHRITEQGEEKEMSIQTVNTDKTNPQKIIGFEDFISNTIPATIEIHPDKWNIHWLKEEKKHKEDHQGKGKIKCYIGNITDHSVDNIRPGTVVLNNTVSISEHGKKEKPDAKIKKHRKEFEGEVLEVEFNKFEAIKNLGEINIGDTVTVTVTGELSDGKTFKGEDTIQIIGKEPKE